MRGCLWMLLHDSIVSPRNVACFSREKPDSVQTSVWLEPSTVRWKQPDEAFYLEKGLT